MIDQEKPFKPKIEQPRNMPGSGVSALDCLIFLTLNLIFIFVLGYFWWKCFYRYFL